MSTLSHLFVSHAMPPPSGAGAAHAADGGDAGVALGLLRVKMLPGVNPNPHFGLILDSTVFR